MKARIVVVEDNYADVILMKKAFTENDIDVELIHFEDGDLALAALGDLQVRPNLILLDMNLPRVGGLEVLHAIKLMPELAHVPVAMVTSSRSPQDRALALKEGALRYIQKPASLDEFLSEVGGGVKELLNQSA